MHQPTVLLVDDEKTNLHLLADFLRSHTHIILARNGNQAVEKAVELLPDLILLDVVMPDIDGFETLKLLRAHPQCKEIPVIFLTGLESPEKEREGLQLGAQDYIHKPFNPEIVKTRIFTQLKIVHQRRQLQKLSQDLARASEAKSRFLANMSHEIRTPLTNIIGYAEAILAEEIDTHEQHHAITAISTNGKHLLRLLNDILDLSRIEAQQLDIAPHAVELEKMLTDLTHLIADKAHSKGIELDLRYEEMAPRWFWADETRVKQILLNLLSNAIKFTEKGFVRLSVRQQDDKLIFSVEDSGIGICKSLQEQLFEAFSQADSSSNRRFEGSGLGLSIARQLATLMSGYIELNSEPGQGSCFNLILPFRLPREHEMPSVQHPTTPDKLCGHVLLAEDSDESRHLISRMLQAKGLKVTAVTNGHALLERALAEEFDLILSDISMPGMDGLQAISLLRASGVQTPAIALTANAMQQHIEECKEAGFSRHLAKPINRQAFFLALKEFLADNDMIVGIDDIEDESEEIKQLRGQFLNNLPQRLHDIRQAIASENTAELRRLAHKLKGTSALLNFNQISQLASALEQNTHLSGQQKLVEQLTSIIHETQQNWRTPPADNKG